MKFPSSISAFPFLQKSHLFFCMKPVLSILHYGETAGEPAAEIVLGISDSNRISTLHKRIY